MKLSGSSRGGRHLLKNAGRESTEIALAGSKSLEAPHEDGLAVVDHEIDPFANAIDIDYEFVDDNAEDTENDAAGTKASRTKSIIKKALLGAAILIATLAVIIILDVLADTGIIIQQPDVNQQPRPGNVQQNGNPQNPAQPDDTPGQPVLVEGGDNERNENKFTFLILGLDDGDYNSDVIMVMSFDTEEQTIEVVNIPRDTLVNVEWGIKKANSILANMRIEYSSEPNRDKREVMAMDAAKGRFADILGFEVDFWVTVNMRGFAALIDAIGGVDFNVPVRMDYHDPYQNLHIDYARGMHRGLSGRQALEILRYRGYGSADIGRISTQQQFLKAVIEQMLAKRSSINITDLAEVFFKHIKTDISLLDLVWFGKEFIKLTSDSINFQTMPGDNMDYVGRDSYVTIYLDDWLEVINTKLNPFSQEVTENDVSILTRGSDRRLYVTDGNRLGDPSWGSTSRGPATTSGSTGSSSGNQGSSGSNSSGSSGSSGGTPGVDQDTDPPDDTDDPPDGVPGENETPPDAPPDDGDRHQPDEPQEPPPPSETPSGD